MYEPLANHTPCFVYAMQEGRFFTAAASESLLSRGLGPGKENLNTHCHATCRERARRPPEPGPSSGRRPRSAAYSRRTPSRLDRSDCPPVRPLFLHSSLCCTETTRNRASLTRATASLASSGPLNGPSVVGEMGSRFSPSKNTIHFSGNNCAR
ncbi:hypothetical protein VUR80DRAFT_1008 [Thermomyces stellatus]